MRRHVLWSIVTILFCILLNVEINPRSKAILQAIVRAWYAMDLHIYIYTYGKAYIRLTVRAQIRPNIKETEATNLSRWRDVPFMNGCCWCCCCCCCCHPQIFDFSPTINKTINQSCTTGQTNANTNAKYVAYSINFLFVLTIFEIFIVYRYTRLLLLLLFLYLHASGWNLEKQQKVQQQTPVTLG